MARKGISLSMTYVVLGIILLSTAVTVLMYFSGNIEDLDNLISGERDASQDQLAQENCLVQKQQMCQQEGYSEDNWAEDATYNGESCSEYWDEVPRC